jgi:hypothetical protein
MTTTSDLPNFRALCAELLEVIEGEYEGTGVCYELRHRARTALATPPPEPPTVMEILELLGEIEDAGLGQIDLVRAAIERWGK